MTTKKLLTNFLSIVIGLVIATGASYALATWGAPLGSYSGPTSSYPNNNATTPLNTGASDQVVGGGLSIGSWFTALAGGLFDGETVFVGPWRGGSNDPTSTVSFGGGGTVVDAAISGEIHTAGTITVSSLATGVTTPLCVDITGTLILCPPNMGGPSGTPGVKDAAIAVRLYGGFNLDDPNASANNNYVTLRKVGSQSDFSILGTQLGNTPASVEAGSYTVVGITGSCLDPANTPSSTPSVGTTFNVGSLTRYNIELFCSDGTPSWQPINPTP